MLKHTNITKESGRKRALKKGMKALFQLPKDAVPVKEKPAKKRAKTTGRDVSRDSGGEASPTRSPTGSLSF